MRMLKVAVLTLILWLGCGSVLAFSQADTNLSRWSQYTKEDTQKAATTTAMDDSKAIEEQMLRHLEDEMTKIEQEIDQMNQTNTLRAEQQLEIYKENYLNRLEEIQRALENKDFDTYRKNKEQEIAETITADVETYLAQMLSD